MPKSKPNIICLLIILFERTGAEWSYPSVNEVSNWDSYDNCKYGNFQSPININKEDTQYAKFHIETTVPKQARYGVELYKNATLKYTVENEGGENFTTLDWLRGDESNSDSLFYDLNHFEIHWSEDNINGSEHSINKNFGVAEIQFHYYNVLKGKTYQELKGEKDGILIQAYILNVGSKLDLNQLFNFSTSTIKDGKAELSLDLSEIITLDEKSEFYNYVGSITYPECEENVQWLILNEMIDITESQLAQLRSIRSGEIRSNVRTQTGSTNRRVLRSFDIENAGMSLRSLFSVKTLTLAAILLIFMII